MRWSATASAHGTFAAALYRVDAGQERRHRPSVPTAAFPCGAPHRAQASTVGETIDAGFGFEPLGLAVTTAEHMEGGQTELMAGLDEAGEQPDERCAELIDGLAQRLGRAACNGSRRSRASARARRGGIIATDEVPLGRPNESLPRPLLLFTRAEPAEVTALVPEGPRGASAGAA